MIGLKSVKETVGVCLNVGNRFEWKFTTNMVDSK